MSSGQKNSDAVKRLFSSSEEATSETDAGADAPAGSKGPLRLRSKRGLAVLGAALAIVVVAALVVTHFVRSNARPEVDPVAVTVPVALSGLKAPGGTKIGVVVTLGTGTTEGAEWNQAAQGAVVAQQRLALGGTDVELVVEDDRGSARGAEEAVLSLLEQDVAGIVYASSGSHIEAGIAAAAEAAVPVVLPYEVVPAESQGVWSLAPAEKATSDALGLALEGYTRPLLIDVGGGLPSSVEVSDELRFGGAGDIDAFVADVAYRTGFDLLGGGAYAGGQAEEEEEVPPVENPADVLVVSGHPTLQASVVYALQSHNISVPIVLTSQAVSPVFGETLDQQGGSVSSNLRTVGAAWDDAEALGTEGQGRAMSAYLAAVRQFAGDESVTNLTDDALFSESAFAADVRSHDAVLAFAEAISAAGSNDPAQVQGELSALRLVAGNGIAGPGLDFTDAQSLTGEVTVLYATAQQLGLRPETGARTDGLVWIRDPGQP